MKSQVKSFDAYAQAVNTFHTSSISASPATANERLQLAACRLMQQPVVLVPGKCLTIEEWVKRYGIAASVATNAATGAR
jgi:hypothetical protein